MIGWKLKHCSDYELTKEASYLTLMGNLWGIFCELFGEKSLQDIESALYIEHG